MSKEGIYKFPIEVGIRKLRTNLRDALIIRTESKFCLDNSDLCGILFRNRRKMRSQKKSFIETHVKLLIDLKNFSSKSR